MSFIQSFVLPRYNAGAPTATHVSSFFPLFLEMSLFSSIFVPLPFSLCIGEYLARFSLPDVVFLPCDHGLDFFTSAYYM